MSTPLSEAIVKAGLLDVGMIAEMVKWKLPIDLPKAQLENDPETAIFAIQQAIEGQKQVEVRETDLDLLKKFLKTQKKGKLHVVTQHESGDLGVSFGRMEWKEEDNVVYDVSGDYIIPWSSESIADVMSNGETYLMDGRRKVFFTDSRDYFFGSSKAFMVCPAAPKEK